MLFKSIVSIALLATAAAADYTCRWEGTPRTYTITSANARTAMTAAGGTVAGTSAYPHAFGGDTGDGHRLVFPGADPRCNTQTRSLFEFPVLLNNRPFNRNSRTDPPGPARAIYISPAPPALIVCGVVTHVFPSNPRNPFRLCYPIF